MSWLPCLKGNQAPPPEADEDGYTFACQFADVPNNSSIKVKIGNKQIAIFKIKNEKTKIYAMLNTCVHQGTPLAGSPIEEVDGRMCVKCPGHGIQYDLQTGKSVQENGFYVQRIFAVKKKDKEIWVKLNR